MRKEEKEVKRGRTRKIYWIEKKKEKEKVKTEKKSKNNNKKNEQNRSTNEIAIRIKEASIYQNIRLSTFFRFV